MVDLFVLVALVLAILRICGVKSPTYKSLAHVFVGLTIGLGLGMFAVDDGDCKVYLIVGAALTGVEVVAFIVTRVCPTCGAALARLIPRRSRIGGVRWSGR